MARLLARVKAPATVDPVHGILTRLRVTILPSEPDRHSLGPSKPPGRGNQKINSSSVFRPVLSRSRVRSESLGDRSVAKTVESYSRLAAVNPLAFSPAARPDHEGHAGRSASRSSRSRK